MEETQTCPVTGTNVEKIFCAMYAWENQDGIGKHFAGISIKGSQTVLSPLVGIGVKYSFNEIEFAGAALFRCFGKGTIQNPRVCITDSFKSYGEIIEEGLEWIDLSEYHVHQPYSISYCGIPEFVAWDYARRIS